MLHNSCSKLAPLAAPVRAQTLHTVVVTQHAGEPIQCMYQKACCLVRDRVGGQGWHALQRPTLVCNVTQHKQSRQEVPQIPVLDRHVGEGDIPMAMAITQLRAHSLCGWASARGRPATACRSAFLAVGARAAVDGPHTGP